MARIKKIIVDWSTDEDGDNSWLGEMVARTEERYYIDRKTGTLVDAETLDVNGDPVVLVNGLSKVDTREQMCFYESCNHATPGNPDNWKHVSDVQAAFDAAPFAKFGVVPDLDFNPSRAFWLDVLCFVQDYDRLNQYYECYWCFTYCMVRAVVEFDSELGRRTEEFSYIASLGGIESDAGADYRAEVERDLIEEMAHETAKAGMPFNPKNIEIERKGEL